MKHYCKILFALVVSLNSIRIAYAQTYSLRERYNSSAAVSFSLGLHNDKIYTLGAVSDTFNQAQPISSLVVHNLDSSWVNTYAFKAPNTIQTATNENSLIKTSNGDLACVGYVLEQTNTTKCMLLVYDTLGNQILFKTYSAINTNVFFGKRVIQVADGFYVQGIVQFTNFNVDLFLLKTDKLGDELWRKYYGLSNYDEWGAGFIKTNNNRLLITAQRNNRQYSTYQNYKSWSYLLLLDTAGNIIKDTIGNDENIGIPQSLIETQDGSFLYCTDYAVSKSAAYGILNKGYIVKVDSNLNTIWEKQYGTFSTDTRLLNAIELNTGELITCGVMYDTAYKNGNYHENGWVMKLTANGDSIWSREYRGVTRIGQQLEINILYDCDLLNDGSIIACGVAEDDNDTFPQQAWLLRIDADGCMDNNWCGYTGVKEIKGTNAEQPLVKVYPNPAKSILNVKYETTEAEIYIRVTDLLGRELFSKKSTGGKNTEAIATKQWSNGSYIYEVRKENIRIGSGIFVISQ